MPTHSAQLVARLVLVRLDFLLAVTVPDPQSADRFGASQPTIFFLSGAHRLAVVPGSAPTSSTALLTHRYTAALHASSAAPPTVLVRDPWVHYHLITSRHRLLLRFIRWPSRLMPTVHRIVAPLRHT